MYESRGLSLYDVIQKNLLHTVFAVYFELRLILQYFPLSFSFF